MGWGFTHTNAENIYSSSSSKGFDMQLYQSDNGPLYIPEVT